MDKQEIKIGLGTVQFGQDYGITNQTGAMNHSDIKSILKEAHKYKIDLLDTAQAYGDSEKKIGTCIGAEKDKYKIVTKISVSDLLRSDEPLDKCMEELLAISLDSLGQKKIYGVLIHDTQAFLSSEIKGEIWKTLSALQEKGLVDKIGVSCYLGSEIDQILSIADIDIIQVPYNVLDRRLIDSGHLQQLKEKNIEIHARSIFLQGILLAEPNNLPTQFSCLKEDLNALQTKASDLNTNPEALLCYEAWRTGFFDRLIIGTSNIEEFESLVQMTKDCLKLSDVQLTFSDYTEDIYSPSQWS